MSVLDRYKVPYNELNKRNPAWKEGMDHLNIIRFHLQKDKQKIFH